MLNETITFAGGIGTSIGTSSMRTTPPPMKPTIPGFGMAISIATHIPAYQLWPHRWQRKPETSPANTSKYYLEGLSQVSLNEMEITNFMDVE